MTTWDLHEGAPLPGGRTAVARLGGGHRYDVWLARDARTGREQVLKLLRPHLAGAAGAREDLVREARALRLLAHPALVRGLDAAADGPMPHLVLEHVPGPRLSTLARRFGVDLEQLLPLAAVVLEALEHVHLHGWVHLDVKPSNVVMGDRPRLLDLSVARPVAAARRPRGPIGTAAWMAPEQCHATLHGATGPASDLFGLGATLHAALRAGRPPFADDGLPFPQLRRAPGRLPHRVPREVRALVLGLLDPDPAGRPRHDEARAVLQGTAGALAAPVLHRFRPASRIDHPTPIPTH